MGRGGPLSCPLIGRPQAYGVHVKPGHKPPASKVAYTNITYRNIKSSGGGDKHGTVCRTPKGLL